jgi:formylglycine-generating enzyme required for sulfatase activity
LLAAAIAAGQQAGPPPQPAAPASRADFSPAHLCSRCHLHDMLEWSISGHAKAETTCTACHGPSEGHLIDERNLIKPDRVPHGEAIAPLCLGCHGQGCPQSKRKDSCQTCHHVHALLDASKQGAAGPNPHEAVRREFENALEAGAQAVARSQWSEALGHYERALRSDPGDERVLNRTAFCRRRMNPELEGFRVAGSDFDPESGLPLRVEVPELGIQMALVPGGRIDIGDASLPEARLVHTVRVEPFYLSRHEVTQEQWLKVMGANPSAYQQGFEEPDRMPVESVSWNDCREFIARVNGAVAGRGFRLPTEAEWEFACRRGGASEAAIPLVAWYRDNSKLKEAPKAEPGDFASPRPVGAKGANALGLFDMQGNVWEWCSSLLRPYPYDAGDGREDPAAAGLRVLRGGSFVDRADLLGPAMRHGERPDRRFRWNGLRLARTPPGLR